AVRALAQGDQRQQPPQAVPALGGQRPLPIAEKEALVSRLDDVLGVDLVVQPGVELAARQADQPASEALEDRTGDVLLTNHVRNGVVWRHESPLRSHSPGGVAPY